MGGKGQKKEVRARWVLRVGGKVELRVKKGDEVKRGQVLAVSRIRNMGCFNMARALSMVKKETLVVLEKKWRGKKFLQGDLMGKTGGLFGKKILSPVDGKFTELDEFLNMCFELAGSERKEVLSPVDASVVEIEDDKLVLGFEALEFRGEGVVEGKMWGVGRLENICRAVDIGDDCRGKIVLSGEPDEAFLAKADAMGVIGLVTGSKIDDDFSGVDMLVLILEKEEWKSLLEVSGESEERRMLLNCQAGRLLLVI